MHQSRYSDAGRLTAVTQAGVTTTYVINALGQRVQKASSAGTTYFMYDEAGHVVGEYDGSGALLQETVWLGDIPVATLRPAGGGVELYSVHTDHLNTPRRISRPADNAIVWRWDADPFGTTAANEHPDGDSALFVYNLHFPGQYFDVESGFGYNYFREFGPVSGSRLESPLQRMPDHASDQAFPSRLAVNPIGRRLGTGGFMSCRIAERMAAIASSCVASFFSMRGFKLPKSASKFAIGADQLSHANEGAHDLDVDGDGALAAQDGREHRDTLLGKGVRQIAAAAALCV